MTNASTRLWCLTAAFFLGVGAAYGAPKATGRVPELDVKGSCGEAQRFSTQGNDKGVAYKGCMQDELAAKDQLAKRWSSFKAEDRKTCIEQGREPVPSYVEVLTCIEMASGDMVSGGKNPRSGGGGAPINTTDGSAK